MYLNVTNLKWEQLRFLFISYEVISHAEERRLEEYLLLDR